MLEFGYSTIQMIDRGQTVQREAVTKVSLLEDEQLGRRLTRLFEASGRALGFSPLNQDGSFVPPYSS
jgi:hypothetical protein